MDSGDHLGGNSIVLVRNGKGWNTGRGNSRRKGDRQAWEDKEMPLF